MPSIFSRFADIISSNINAMLDKAENPAKMVKLIIAEMEDTLVEIKAACAQAMADQTKNARRLTEADQRRVLWQNRAEQAAAKGRDDLAREALIEKRTVEAGWATLEAQDQELATVVEKYRAEIDQLDAKLTQAREKERLMGHREGRAKQSLKASDQMKKYDLNSARLKLERLDSKLDKLEAEAELEMGIRRPTTSEDQARERAFAELDDSLDQELQALKTRLTAK